MTGPEFQAYLEQDIERFAQERIRAGDWHPSEALQKSREEHQQLQPDGVATRNHYLVSIEDETLGAAKVKALGLAKIALHVFAHNRAARALYEKTGFEITGIYLTKKLTK